MKLIDNSLFESMAEMENLANAPYAVGSDLSCHSHLPYKLMFVKWAFRNCERNDARRDDPIINSWSRKPYNIFLQFLNEVSYFEPNSSEIMSVFLCVCEIRPQLVGILIVNCGEFLRPFPRTQLFQRTQKSDGNARLLTGKQRVCFWERRKLRQIVNYFMTDIIVSISYMNM
jgi:hypothetical protein